MLEFHPHIPARSAMRAEFVGDHGARAATVFAKELTQKPFGGALITAALDQNVENKAFLIDGAPKPMLPAVDRNDDFIEMPFVSVARGVSADLVGEVPPEFLRPSPNRFVADDGAARGQKVLDHSQAERKAEIEPDRMGDDFGGKAMAAIKGAGRLDHRRQLPENRSPTRQRDGSVRVFLEFTGLGEASGPNP